MNISSLSIIIVFIISLVTCVHGHAQQQQHASAAGWFQIDGNSNRNRYSEYTPSTTSNYKTTNVNIIPNSLVQHRNKNYCCGIENGPQSRLVRLESDGTLSKFVSIPNEFELLDVLPVLDSDDNYYTVRKNVSNSVYFVLRTSISQGTNTILYDTFSLTRINAMILTQYNNELVISYGNFLLSVDSKSGNGKWIRNYSNIGLDGSTQFLLDAGSYLYIATKSSVSLIELSSGYIKASSTSVSSVNLSSNQPLLDLGSSLIVVFGNAAVQSSVYIYDKNNLANQELPFRSRLSYQNGVSVDLTKCSNAISLSNKGNSFYLSCKAFNSYQVLRFDVSNSTVSLGYQIDLNVLSGIPPTVCVNQLAAYGKEFFAVACDSGLFIFSSSGTKPRKELRVDINVNTQVFGSVYNYFIITNNNGITEYQTI